MINKEFKYPWEETSFNNLFNRDDRFFALVTKGFLAWMEKNIIMYGKPVRHFVFNTGTSYMYLESNGYTYSMEEVTDQDTIYMERPRCVVEFDTVEVNTEELTQPNIRGVYERTSKTEVQGFNAEMRRIPLTVTFNLHYVLSNFNESIILLQEYIHKVLFQKYFKIVYLGQVVECSIEIPGSLKIEFNKIDMTSTEPQNKHLDLTVSVFTNYPAIVEETESTNDKVIAKFSDELNLTDDTLEKDPVPDTVKHTVE